jgi:hypothetical protein
MNWEMFGGAAVIASLVFVGYQLRQQSNIERAKAQRDPLMQIREWVSLPSQNKDYFNAIQRCLDDFDNADDWCRPPGPRLPPCLFLAGKAARQQNPLFHRSISENAGAW